MAEVACCGIWYDGFQCAVRIRQLLWHVSLAGESNIQALLSDNENKELHFMLHISLCSDEVFLRNKYETFVTRYDVI